MANRLVSHRLEARYLANQVEALQQNGSDVYWSFIDTCSAGDQTAALIERVLPVNDEGKVLVRFTESALRARSVPADEMVSIHYVARM